MNVLLQGTVMIYTEKSSTRARIEAGTGLTVYSFWRMK